MLTAPEIVERRQLGADERDAVLAVAAAAAEVDGVAPLSERVLLNLRPDPAVEPAAAPGQPVRHLLGRNGRDLLGYGQLDAADPAGGARAELVVHPRHRRRGLGSALLAALEAADPDGRLRVWAHGRLPAAAALARARRYVEERVLHRLHRPLADLPAAPLPAGVRLRPFVPGADDRPWVELNNRAFAGHPDQGGWTLADLRQRTAEPWFDPAGFLLAERVADGSLVGFHWTKVHAAEPIGEVYVLGVDPAAQGTGLGAALTVAGLRHLRERGLGQALLYVDESNPAALRLYRRLGFGPWGSDVQYRRPAR